mmetsp:Transcript_9962/g.30868  ORF Transcript_9962/g.30868 Transcript_9962/m.30868 type:complete len:91 (+) Transcript_9962:166-438(+)
MTAEAHFQFLTSLFWRSLPRWRRTSGGLSECLSVWSNDMDCPLICLSTPTTSMDDPAFVMAANCYGTLCKDGRAVVICYVDNPHPRRRGY